MDEDPDAELMLKVAAGDRAAFGVLFDRHQGSVCRFARRFVGDGGRAEELAQDIFVKLYRSAKSYRPSAKFKTFLFRVATNHCLNEVRRGEYRMPHSAEAHEADGPGAPAADTVTPDQALHGKELEAAVGSALAAMTERERAAFTMCRFEGMAYRDIAEALSASEAAVKSLIHRATLAVAKRIDELQAGLSPARSRA
ncbi:MAG: RNA polymerase sigma factor [Myxococcaceae bacterium]